MCQEARYLAIKAVTGVGGRISEAPQIELFVRIWRHDIAGLSAGYCSQIVFPHQTWRTCVFLHQPLVFGVWEHGVLAAISHTEKAVSKMIEEKKNIRQIRNRKQEKSL